MKEFPRHILILAFFNLIPLFLSVFFLYGGILAPQTEVGDFKRLLIYICVQMLWVLPIASTFIGLNQYRLGYPKRAGLTLLVGNALTIACIVLFGMSFY
ncbi:MAG: hypothetical protein IKR91_01245 [Alloprevotella sp.]|nr:hypothetical protein [Alloprevotella sp.]